MTGVANVMLLLPKALQTRVPVQGAAAPAAVISLKSTSVKATVAAVTVTDVPNVEDETRRGEALLVPVNVRVPEIVYGAENCTISVVPD